VSRVSPSGNPIHGEPPDPVINGAYWRLLHAAVLRAQREISEVAIDEMCDQYSATLTPAVKKMIAIRARGA
jgi:hypothetical protein